MNPLILVDNNEPDVEDLFRQQFRRDLRADRFTMDLARSAMQALEMVAQAKASLILMLSDVNLPGMSGLDLLPKARQVRPDVPVIMITANGDQRLAARRSSAVLRLCSLSRPYARLKSSQSADEIEAARPGSEILEVR